MPRLHEFDDPDTWTVNNPRGEAVLRIVLMTGIVLAAAGSAWAQDANVAAGEKVYKVRSTM